MKIALTSVFVDDQRAALAFYTEVLGFTKRRDVPVGDNLWLTVVSPDHPDGPELLLEPSGHPAVKPYRDALVEDGIPLAQFAVDDLEAEHARLISNGVVFTQPPTDIGTAVVAVFDDTCGNLIQLIEEKPEQNTRHPLRDRESGSLWFGRGRRRTGPVSRRQGSIGPLAWRDCCGARMST